MPLNYEWFITLRQSIALENVRILLFLNENEFRYVNHYTIERFIVSTKRSGKTPPNKNNILYACISSIMDNRHSLFYVIQKQVYAQYKVIIIHNHHRHHNIAVITRLYVMRCCCSNGHDFIRIHTNVRTRRLIPIEWA